MFVNHEDGVFVDSAGLQLRLLVPYGMVADEISISVGPVAQKVTASPFTATRRS